MIRTFEDIHKSRTHRNETLIFDHMYEADEKNGITEQQYKQLTRYDHENSTQYFVILQHDNLGTIFHTEIEFDSLETAKIMYDNIQSFYMDTAPYRHI